MSDTDANANPAPNSSSNSNGNGNGNGHSNNEAAAPSKAQNLFQATKQPRLVQVIQALQPAPANAPPAPEEQLHIVDSPPQSEAEVKITTQGVANNQGRTMGEIFRKRAASLVFAKKQKKRDDDFEAQTTRNGEHRLKDIDEVEYSVIDYSPIRVFHAEGIRDMKHETILARKPDWASARWLNIDGINPDVVSFIGERYQMHQLMTSDIVELVNRAKMDFYENEGNIFIISKMLSIENDEDTEIDEEIIFFFYDSNSQTVITFQEGRPGDVWSDLRKRILERPNSKVRQSGADYLLFGLLDALLETCYPIVEKFGTRMEDLEFKLLKHATPYLNEQVYHLKRELLFLRRSVWPLRDAVLQIISEDMPTNVIHEECKHFFRSINDRLLQINDMVETYSELAIGLGGLYSNQQAQKMNNVMFVLTLVSAIFIPLTFIAGIYGMNFEYIPELGWHYGYLYFWCMMIGCTSFIMFLFWMRGWIGGSSDEEGNEADAKRKV